VPLFQVIVISMKQNPLLQMEDFECRERYFRAASSARLPSTALTAMERIV